MKHLDSVSTTLKNIWLKGAVSIGFDKFFSNNFTSIRYIIKVMV